MMTEPLLVLEGLTRRYGGISAITELSLTIDAGSISAVIGPAGAGKTTLVDLIAGACRPDQGGIRFAGRDLTGLGPDRTCIAGIARTFHPPRPFPGLNVLDSVMIPALLREPGPAEARRLALDIRELLGLRRLAGQPAASLTLAQSKRLELARAVATRPRLLVLDQILTELSEAELTRVQDVLLSLNRRPGLTLLLVEPRLDTVRALADRVVLLEHGHIITEAAADDLPE